MSGRTDPITEGIRKRMCGGYYRSDKGRRAVDIDLAALLHAVNDLKARLAAAEAEWYEWKDIASVFLAATEPNQPIPVQGQIMLAQVRERARARFYAHLASRPEGEVRHG